MSIDDSVMLLEAAARWFWQGAALAAAFVHIWAAIDHTSPPKETSDGQG